MERAVLIDFYGFDSQLEVYLEDESVLQAHVSLARPLLPRLLLFLYGLADVLWHAVLSLELLLPLVQPIVEHVGIGKPTPSEASLYLGQGALSNPLVVELIPLAIVC